MSDTWIHLNNPFRSTTEGNFKLMLTMSTDMHDKITGALANEPALQPLHQQVLKPAFEAFGAAYVAVAVQKGRYRRRTQRVEELLDELSGPQIDTWELNTQLHFRKSTGEYQQLFPDGRAPFQKGTYEARINALGTLVSSLSDFPLLAQVRTEVDAFRQNLLTARSEQQGFEGGLADLRANLEQSRLELANAMFRTFGFLLYHCNGDADRVSRFFELQYLRSPQPGGEPDAVEEGVEKSEE